MVANSVVLLLRVRVAPLFVTVLVLTDSLLNLLELAYARQVTSPRTTEPTLTRLTTVN